MAMVNNTIIDEDDINEDVVRRLVEQLGEMPEHFTIELIVTVVVTPDRYSKFARDLWGCAG